MTKIKGLIILFLFYSIQLYSQSEYIIDKKGNKIIIDEGSSQMTSVVSENTPKVTTTIFFTIKDKKETIDLLDVKEASYGSYKISTFKFDLEYLDKELPFFTLVEYNGFRLISLEKTKLNTFSFIIDSSGKIIEELSLKSYKYKGKELENRARVDSKLREYFGSCEQLVRRLDRYKYNNSVITFKSKFVQNMRKPNEVSKNENYENLNLFFNNPLFQQCQ